MSGAPKLRPRVLLLGKNGQIGWELLRALAPIADVHALGHDDVDLCDPMSLRNVVRSAAPDLIVNAAAFTAVERAEREPELAMAVNGIAPGVLAEEAERLDAGLIHYSTDYVYDGDKQSPYMESDTPRPLNVYGRTKLAGDLAVAARSTRHLILRTGWVYGMRGRNFVGALLAASREKAELRVVDDQIGAPTFCRLIADATAQIVAQEGAALREHGGVYHLSSSGATTWYDFALAFMQRAPALGGRAVPIRPIKTADHSPLPRPRNSVLCNDRLDQVFGLRLADWKDGLSLALESHTAWIE